jgi:hypothetical protein
LSEIARTAPTLKTTTFSGFRSKKTALTAVFCSSQRGLIHFFSGQTDLRRRPSMAFNIKRVILTLRKQEMIVAT